MKLLSTKRMENIKGGEIDEQWCNDTAKTRYIMTGVFSAISFIPVVGWIIAAPSSITLYALDGVCLFN